MAMTRREQIAKDQIIRTLQKSGYPTYASLLDLFHVNLTEDPNVVAYMEPGKGQVLTCDGFSHLSFCWPDVLTSSLSEIFQS